MQLTDVSARRTDPRLTDSQKFIKEEEPKILDWVEQEARAPQAPRRSRSRARAAEVRARRAAEHRRCGGVGRRQVRVPRRQRSRAVAHGASAALRQRVVFHRRDPGAHVRGRRAGSPPHRGAQSRERRGGVGRTRRRERSDRDSEAAVRRRAAPGGEAGSGAEARRALGQSDPVARRPHRGRRRCAPPTTPSAGSR